MKSRKPVELGERINKRWLGYAAAAGAAGVGMVATVQRARADIIYTPAHTTVSDSVDLNLDLNHDGIADFHLSNSHSFFCVTAACTSFRSHAAMSIHPRSGNGALGHSDLFVSMLARGAPIEGPGQ
jgi:hypothetical protein